MAFGMNLKDLGLEEAADRILTGLEDLAAAIRDNNSVQIPTTKGELRFQLALQILSHQTALPSNFSHTVDSLWEKIKADQNEALKEFGFNS